MTTPTWLLGVSSVFISVGSPGSNSGPDWGEIGAIAALLGVLLVVVTYILPLTPLHRKIGNWLHPVGSAFKRALQTASEDFEGKHPGWRRDLHRRFFKGKGKGAKILAKFLERGGNPTPQELVTYWTNFIHNHHPKVPIPISELEPAATEFLLYLAQAFKAELESRGSINDHKAEKLISKCDKIISDCEKIRDDFRKEQAIAQARPKYLEWLIEHCKHPVAPDPSEQQTSVELDKVYISLRVRREATSTRKDKTNLEECLEQIDPNLTSEEQRKQQQACFQSELDAAMGSQNQALDIAKIINSHNHLVILGDPGSGKSTLLQYLALKHAEASKEQTEVDADLGKTRFPILIHIADYAQHLADCAKHNQTHKSLNEYLADLMHKYPQDGLKDLLEEELAKGNCLILMDGHDEVVKVADRDDRGEVVKQIKDFVGLPNISSNNHFIVTSRIYGYRSAPLNGPFVEYTLEPMDDDQRHLFLERWYDAMGTSQKPQAQRKAIQGKIQALLDSEQNLERENLIKNPLLLLLLGMTFVYYPGGTLLTKQVDLYKEVTKFLAITRPKKRNVPESELVEEKYLTPLLSQLAYWLHTNKSNGEARESEICDIFHQEPEKILAWWRYIHPETREIGLSDTKGIIGEAVTEFLTRVTWHTGLLVKGEHEESYGFIYRSFQEYYAAHYLFDSSTRIGLIRRHLHDPYWDQPVLLAIGLVGLESSAEESSELLKRAILADRMPDETYGIFPSPYEELLGRDYLFALRCLADRVPVNNELMERLISQLKDELLQPNLGTCTERACFERYQQALQERLKSLRGSPAAARLLEELVDALDTSDANIFSRVTEAIGYLRQPSPRLLAVLLTKKTRKEAIQCLGELGDASQSVCQILFDALKDGTPGIPKAAAESLGKLGRISPEVVRGLLDHLNQLNHTNPAVRNLAREALTKLQNPSLEVVKVLCNALMTGDDPDIRSILITVLSKSGHLPDEAVPDLLKNLLHDLQNSREDRRMAAAKSLGELRQSSLEVVKALREALHDRRSDVAKEAAKSLGELRYPTTIANDKRKSILESISGKVTKILDTLKHSDPRELDGFFKALIDQVPHVDEETVRGQQEIHYPTALLIREVIQIADSLEDEKTRTEVHKEVTEHLLAASLEDEEYPTALVVRDLIKLLKDQNERLLVRQEAVTTLGSLAETFPEFTLIYPILDILCEVAQGALKGTSDDSNPTIRTNAIKSLSKLKDTSGKVVTVLAGTLSGGDEDPSVRAAAAENLEQCGQVASKDVKEAMEKAVKALCQVLYDNDFTVRLAAAWSLSELQQAPSEVEEALFNALMSPANPDRRLAALLLGQFGKGNPATVKALWGTLPSSMKGASGLRDANIQVASACAQALAQITRGFSDPQRTEKMKKCLKRVIQNRKFDPRDHKDRLSAHNYAFEALWLLAVGGQAQGGTFTSIFNGVPTTNR